MLKPNALLTVLLISTLSVSQLFSIDVLVAKEKIKYKAKVKLSNLRLKKVKGVRNSCIPITINGLGNDHYITKHFINAGTIICEKDIKIYERNTVVFNFGNIEIEKEGKLIGETKRYIRIKKPNGRIEKIYKNGSTK